MGENNHMKNFITAALMLLTGLAHGAASDVAVEQRNLTNNGWITRLMASPPTNGLLIYNTSTLLPNWVTTAGGLTLTGSILTGVEQANWNSVSGSSQILNKPTLATVATSGAYADLTGKPTIPAAQVQSDWNAVSAPAAILNKPPLFSGAYADLTGIPSTFTPSAHTHGAADIVSGTLAVARIPSLPISQTTGLQTALDSKFATPTGTSAQYLRGDGSVATFPSIPAAQVNSDWNSVSGVSQILNKPAAFPPSSHNQPWSTITSTPTTVAGYGLTDAATTAQLSTKFNNPTGTISQYIRGDGSLATLPVAKRIETYTGTTNASGQVTITYPSAFATVPNVQTPPPGLANQVWTLTSSTTTGFTAVLNQRNVVTLLGLEVLLGAVVPVSGSAAQIVVIER
jgi:hypothetical protein